MKNKSDERKDIVVLGSEGFIGSHFFSYLSKRDYKVHDFTKSRPLFTPDGNMTVDLNEASDIFWFSSKINPAIAANNPDLVDQEMHYFQSSLNSLRQQNKNYRIIFPSSGGTIYGESRKPCSEFDSINPVNEYGKYKFAKEQLLRESELQHVILRISNVFGPNQPIGRGQGVIAEWLTAIKSYGSITLYGEETITRDFLYIEDLMTALSKCILIGRAKQTYNIGSGVGTTLGRVLEVMQDITGIDFQVKIAPKRAIDRLAIEIDISLAKIQLDWAPKFSLSEGIQKVWNSILIS